MARAQSLPPEVESALKRAHIPLSAVAAYVQGVDGARRCSPTMQRRR